ncbi:MAG TPA: hypothetical protein VHE12_11905 [bacterium]|nr:hypothetical protein [bacterium]
MSLSKTLLLLGVFLSMAPAFAGPSIPALQKRIKKDRRDILFYLTRITEAQGRMKADRARAAKAGEEGPEGKWTARAAQEAASVEKDRVAQAKAQRDLAAAQAELDRLLSK